jgi:hypothetical protein
MRVIIGDIEVNLSVVESGIIQSQADVDSRINFLALFGQ